MKSVLVIGGRDSSARPVRRLIDQTDFHVVSVDKLIYVRNPDLLAPVGKSTRHFFERVDSGERAKGSRS